MLEIELRRLRDPSIKRQKMRGALMSGDDMNIQQTTNSSNNKI